MNHDLKQLEEAGYLVRVNTPFHWEVKKPGKHNKKIVSVWPTAHKILTKYDPGPAPRYEGSMLAAVNKCFAKVDYPPLYTPGQEEAMGFVWELRERGLDVIKELMSV